MGFSYGDEKIILFDEAQLIDAVTNTQPGSWTTVDLSGAVPDKTGLVWLSAYVEISVENTAELTYRVRQAGISTDTGHLLAACKSTGADNLQATTTYNGDTIDITDFSGSTFFAASQGSLICQVSKDRKIELISETTGTVQSVVFKLYVNGYI